MDEGITVPDPTLPVDPGMLRRVCGMFVTGVTVITTGPPGQSAGTTVNSFTSVSLDPPLVLFCLHRRSRLREVLLLERTFAVNFLAGRQQRLAWDFAGRDTAVVESVAHHRSDGGVPILSKALAYLVCELADEFDGGDHSIFLGRVVELDVPHQHHEPLIFFRGAMGSLADGSGEPHPMWDA